MRLFMDFIIITVLVFTSYLHYHRELITTNREMVNMTTYTREHLLNLRSTSHQISDVLSSHIDSIVKHQQHLTCSWQQRRIESIISYRQLPSSRNDKKWGRKDYSNLITLPTYQSVTYNDNYQKPNLAPTGSSGVNGEAGVQRNAPWSTPPPWLWSNVLTGAQCRNIRFREEEDVIQPPTLISCQATDLTSSQPKYLVPLRREPKIGRASCRERV